MSEQLLLEEINQDIKNSINPEEKVNLLVKKSRLCIKLKKIDTALNTLLEAFHISPQNEDVRSSLNTLKMQFQGIGIFSNDYIKAILLDNSKKSDEQEVFSCFLGPNQDLQIKNFINGNGIYDLMEGFSKSLYDLHFSLTGRLILMLCSLSDLASKSMIDYVNNNTFDATFLSKVPDTIVETLFLIFCKKNLWSSTKTWEFFLLKFFNDISNEIKESGKERQMLLLKNISNIFSLEDTIFQIFCNSYSLCSVLSLFDLRNGKEIRKLSSLIISKLIKKKDIITEQFLQDRIFDYILECLKENTNKKLIEIYSIYIHIFALDSSIAGSLFLKNGFLEELCADIQNDDEVNLFFLQMISSSCINSNCREKLLEMFIPTLNDLRKEKNIKINSLSEIIMIKLTYQINKKENTNNLSKENILNLTKNIVSIISQDYINVSVSFIEGLTYLSMFSHVKEYIVSKERLFMAISKRIKEESDDISFIFSTLVCIKNIVSYKPKLTEEQEQIIKLKNILQEHLTVHEDNLESDEKVSERCLKIINHQILIILNSTLSCKLDSIKTFCSKIILSLATKPKHRFLLAEQGVIRILYNIIKDSQIKALTVEDSETNFQYPAIVSLAKMLITINPNSVFDRSRFQVDDIVIYIYECLKVSENNNLLVQFECLLALTNLTSLNIEVREKFISILWPMIEWLWLSDNQLIQRSAVELLCNLVACPSGITIFSKKRKQRIHILLALADSPDKKTRIAAGGALAILSNNISICEAMLEKKEAIKIILDMVNEETDDLIHRGLVCIENIIHLMDSKNMPIFKELNIAESLSRIIKKTKNKEIIDLSYQIIQKLKKVNYISE
ncbi:uncharacterized protein T551_03011 [Pneumocystis jirovecii RU7]|uniref:UNC-45/Cro1/She4 central domain-containing protein n=1 Tax=Pneumocystis jirovecii (strain RU7) TaxID=1408657 RepID=A0A0W4ZGL0_PNEJ7|nr:uncharacterized protein T551_03011 [Pneumocystis jirovecii RU7]KTW27512.1 hypothetical protein T551_03011 [Pneumocystis jirovecii RU7]